VTRRWGLTLEPPDLYRRLAQAVLGANPCCRSCHAIAGFLLGVPERLGSLLTSIFYDEHEVGPKRLSSFIPDGFTVTKRQAINLDGAGRDEVVLTAVGPSRFRLVPARVLVLAYEEIGNRWVTVFDAANVDAPTDPPGPLFNPNHAVQKLRIFTVRPDRTAAQDLVISAHLQGGAGAGFNVVAVVRYRHHSADPIYIFKEQGVGSASPGSGLPQSVKVRSSWYTPANPSCCPTSDYVFEVASDGNNYRLIKDDRPFLGAHVVWDNTPNLLVVEIVPNTPADGVLEVGDEIIAVSGRASPPPSESGATLLNDLSHLRRGANAMLDVLRNGKLQSVSLKVADRTSIVSRNDVGEKVPTSLGMNLETEGRNPLVVSIDPDGPAASAGITPGSRITAINGVPVSFAATVFQILITQGSLLPLNVSYADPTGNSHDVVIEPALSNDSNRQVELI
jgi:hypothetical protein